MDVSVVIPCFNSGGLLLEAVGSVHKSKDINNLKYEIIIVNDGSADKYTLNLLTRLESEGCRIIHQINKGPAAARNTGVSAATGKYILFLDSDNKIRNNFIRLTVNAITATDADIVYGKPFFFGDSTEELFSTGPFDINKMLFTNHIDTCSMIKKDVWLKTGGLDENRVLIGFEDWDFWLRAYFAGFKFKFLNEFLFDYRIRTDSLLSEKNTRDNAVRVADYVCGKHPDLILKAYREILPKYYIYQQQDGLYFSLFFPKCYRLLKDIVKWILRINNEQK